MKYIKYTILICLLIGVLYVGRSLYKKEQMMPDQSVPTIQANNNVQQKTEVVSNTKKQIGDLVFEYPQDTTFLKDDINYLNLNIKIKSVGIDQESLKKYEQDYIPVKLFYSKSQNPQNLPIEKWFDLNNPADEKQSPFEVLNSEKIKIGDTDVLKVIFSSAPYLTGGYYNLQSVYITHNSDIYEIQSYSLPSTPDTALTPEDIKNIGDYQKSVDQIIQSIHFVK